MLGSIHPRRMLCGGHVGHPGSQPASRIGVTEWETSLRSGQPGSEAVRWCARSRTTMSACSPVGPPRTVTPIALA